MGLKLSLLVCVPAVTLLAVVASQPKPATGDLLAIYMVQCAGEPRVAFVKPDGGFELRVLPAPPPPEFISRLERTKRVRVDLPCKLQETL